MRKIKRSIIIGEIAKSINLDSKVLFFRPYGINVKQEMLNLIDKAYSAIEINFSGVEICDVSFVDEVVLNFKESVLKKRTVFGDGFLIYITNCNNDIMVNLEASILLREKNDKEKCPILLWENDSFKIVGNLEKNLMDTFELIASKKNITANDVSNTYKIEINSASNRLKKLYDFGLINRSEEIDSMGKHYVYSLPTE